MTGNSDPIARAEVVLGCADLGATLAFFTGRLGFRIESIFPADDPAEAALSGHGLNLRLRRGADAGPGVLRLTRADGPPSPKRSLGFAQAGAGPEVVTAPNGTRIEFVEPQAGFALPPVCQQFSVTRRGTEADWVVGRAGMRYRDLIPGRQGGRFIASHILIPDGGPVPDYVHYHAIRFQLIYCYRGWVEVVYEDQGPPFVMRPGDCVLQPPEIRHRVLRSSAGLEVIEISSPAEHLTSVDHDMTLPTPTVRPGRAFGGQRFVRHEAAAAARRPWRLAGFEARDSGIGRATDGLAGVRVARPAGAGAPEVVAHAGEFLFLFVLDGTVALETEGEGRHDLAAGDAVVVPAGLAHRLTPAAAGLELLDVTLPADLPLTRHGAARLG